MLLILPTKKMFRTVMEMLHYPHFKIFVFLQKETRKNKKRKKPGSKNKNTFLVALSDSFRHPNPPQIFFLKFRLFTFFDVLSELSLRLTRLVYSNLKDSLPTI